MVSTIEDKSCRILRVPTFQQTLHIPFSGLFSVKDFGSFHLAPPFMRVLRENCQTETINCANDNCNVCRNGALFIPRS